MFSNVLWRKNKLISLRRTQFSTGFPKGGGYTARQYAYIFLNICSQIFFLRECSDFDIFVTAVWNITASQWSRSKSFLNPHMVNLSVCLINIFKSVTSVKIRQWPGNFGMFLNYIALLYKWKIVIASYIDIFTRHLQ